MSRRRFFILPGVVSILLMGLVLTTLAFLFFYRENEKSIRYKLEEESNVYTGIIINKINHYLALTLSLRNFFEFSENVTRDEFAGFTSLMLTKEEGGIKALCWVPLVKKGQRQQFELTARKEGFVRFCFFADSDSGQPSDEGCFPVYYIEPFAENAALFGRDLNAEQDLKEAFEKVIQTGSPITLTKTFTAAKQEKITQSDTCWIIVPVFYRHGIYYTEQGRRQCLAGYLVEAVDIPRMMQSILHGTENSRSGVNFHIEDITDSARPVFLGDIPGCCRNLNYAEHLRHVVTANQFQFTDRVLKINCVKNRQSPFAQNNAWMVWLVLPVGVLLTGLVVLYLYTLYCRNELADSLVEKRTRELKEQKEKADTIAIAAERSNRAKSAFLAGMSHDIRTPMNEILGFCELLSEESLDKNQKQYVNIIYNSSKNLLALLNDVLDLSKIEIGKMHIESRDCDIQEILDSVKQMFQTSAQNRGLDFRVIIQTKNPGIIQSDPLRIRQCLVNLIGNAIKFTEQGHVYVYVLLDRKKGRLKIAVEDTGVGIPETYLESVFEAFSTADSSSCQEERNRSGLGLAISRQLARLMGGDVAITSTVGRGSVVTFEIPVHCDNRKTELISEEAGAKGGWDIL